MSYVTSGKSSPGKNFSNHVVLGSAYNLGGQFLKFVCQFGSSILLARLLEPKDFGLVVMAGSFSSFVRVFEDLGLSTAAVQAKQISSTECSNLFWINILFGTILCIMCMCSAPILSLFFHSPAVRDIALVSSVGFLLSAVASQHRALLLREMRFGVLAGSELLAMVLGAVVGVGLAYRGLGHWALVAMNLSTAAFSSVFVSMASGWRPRGPDRMVDIWHFVRFGRNVTLANLVNYFVRDFDKIVVGRVCGSEALGVYSRAYNLFMIPLSQVVWPMCGVALPTLSKLQGDPERYSKYHVGGLYVLVVALTPFSVWVFVMSEEIINLIYGKKWLVSAPILALFSLSLPLQPVFAWCNLLYTTTGRSSELLKYHSICAIWTVVCVLCGSAYGSKFVALAYSIAFLVWIFPGCYFACKGSPVGGRSIIDAVWSSLFAGVASTLIILIIKSKSYFDLSGLLGLALAAGLVIITFFGLMLILGEHKRLVLITRTLIMSRIDAK